MVPLTPAYDASGAVALQNIDTPGSPVTHQRRGPSIDARSRLRDTSEMGSKAGSVQFEAKFGGDPPVLAIDVRNRGTEPITVVTLPRYLRLELKDASGQFVVGTIAG